MKITILCSSREHPVFSHLDRWKTSNSGTNEISLISSVDQLGYGDILFLISCSEIINNEKRSNFSKVLVVHASDLPRGRGWSPHAWEISEGAEELTISLLEAEDKVDTGAIWKKIKVPILKTDLFEDISNKISITTAKLMNFAVQNFATISPTKQDEIGATYYPRRNPKDSEVDIYQNIASQLDKIRVSDPERYPAYFYIGETKIIITLRKA